MNDPGSAPLGVPTSRLGYKPGLDGLRAVSVVAVFLFHAGVLQGGFVGVDVFFVISGFLITRLALDEISATGRLSLARFWARRARRLLPAFFAVLAAVLVSSLLAGGAALQRAGRDIVASAFYVSNWAQIEEGRDYFASTASPSLLEHAWSLAVEEQFYIVWPLALATIGAVFISRVQSVHIAVATVAAIGGLGSVGISLWLASDADTALSRLYYGTDTRSIGLAVGAVAGALLQQGPRARQPWRVEGFVGLAGLLTLAVVIDGSERWLYGPGFLAVALLSLMAIRAATAPGPIGTVLSSGPLVQLGRMSYGFYLWHWPVILVLDSERTGLSGPVLGALWVAVTAALTWASWMLIERRAPLPTLRHPHYAFVYTGAGLDPVAEPSFPTAPDRVPATNDSMTPGCGTTRTLSTAFARTPSSCHQPSHRRLSWASSSTRGA